MWPLESTWKRLAAEEHTCNTKTMEAVRRIPGARCLISLAELVSSRLCWRPWLKRMWWTTPEQQLKKTLVSWCLPLVSTRCSHMLWVRLCFINTEMLASKPLVMVSDNCWLDRTCNHQEYGPEGMSIGNYFFLYSWIWKHLSYLWERPLLGQQILDATGGMKWGEQRGIYSCSLLTVTVIWPSFKLLLLGLPQYDGLYLKPTIKTNDFFLKFFCHIILL